MTKKVIKVFALTLGIIFLISVFGTGMSLVSADYPNAYEIELDPDGLNAGDRKYVILFDKHASGNQRFYYRMFETSDPIKIKNSDTLVNIAGVDHIVVINTDSDRDNNADDWSIDWIKVKDSSGNELKKWDSGRIEFGEWDDSSDVVVYVWTLTSTSFYTDEYNSGRIRDKYFWVYDYYSFKWYSCQQAYKYGYANYITGWTSGTGGYYPGVYDAIDYYL